MDAHDQQRRIFLRAALGTGSALALPLIIAGTASLPAVAQSASTASAQGGGTVPKAQAKYQEQPKGDQSCAKCQQFVAETSTCKVVAGRVSPQGWCMFWAKKA